MILKDKKVLVYGLGKSGLSSLKLLKNKGAVCLVFDDDESKKKDLLDGVTWEADLKCADIIVLSPSIHADRADLMELRLSGKQIISEIELGYNFCDAEIIAVTGTNGKTTTTMLIDEILRTAFFYSIAAGNIGLPFCDVCESLNIYETVVLEVSSYQLESINKFSPDVAVLLNITPDHIERHKTFDEYARIKSRIFENQAACDIAVVNEDDENIVKMKPSIKAKIVPFSLKKKVDGAYLENGYVKYKETPVLCYEELNFKSKELENVLAAVCVAMEKNIHPFVISCALKRFKKPEHRLQTVRKTTNKTYINDSKSTNIDAALCACLTMSEPTLLILGGQDKGEDFRFLFENMPKTITKIFITGENAKNIEHAGKLIGYKNITIFETLSECVKQADKEEEKIVLFSPASKSFDRYRNFEDRGERFCEIVGALDE